MNAKGHCYPRSIILQAVYFKLRFTLSYRDVEEIMKMRGVHFDHATIRRWVYKFSLLMEMQMKKRKVQGSGSWRMDETYIKLKGQWCYLYRKVDRSGNTVDFLLTKRRQRMSAQSFLIKGISNNCRPRVIKAVLILQRSKSITNVLYRRLKSDSANISTILSNRTIVSSSGAYKTD